MRYMPTFRVPVFGSWVMTAGSVMNGAGSPGQQCWIGRRSRSTSSPSSTTSWWAARRTVFGRESAIDFSVFRPRTFSARPCGGCISSTEPSLAAASSRLSTPSARHMRRSVPNWLIRSGSCEPFVRSNRSAGPPLLTVRSTISVTSRYGSTSALTRTSSPSRSRSAIHSRRSAGAVTALQSRALFARAMAWSRLSSLPASQALVKSGSPMSSFAARVVRSRNSSATG